LVLASTRKGYENRLKLFFLEQNQLRENPKPSDENMVEKKMDKMSKDILKLRKQIEKHTQLNSSPDDIQQAFFIPEKSSFRSFFEWFYFFLVIGVIVVLTAIVFNREFTSIHTILKQNLRKIFFPKIN
jgi:neutral trehalase